ncbi:MAG: sulfatase-like hydrolase/transferase [Fuerstiella sp.]|jgi:arylsulfatase A|nr:sulfatase-like hydrolase/transferase [Fuerstiella sp.]MCP4505918.1 sulfatase-like hydrolase/transferase [Fuerstiella sp.]MDG2131003.1 sulfatase-like hydrolase/transferase [Fuerstiella sp.]
MTPHLRLLVRRPTDAGIWWLVLIGLSLQNRVLLAEVEVPNVVLIMADDSAVDNYSCYGSTYFSTPRIDELARTGAKFNHCYSEPVCTSSRVKIMTGRDGYRNYVRFGTLDRSETTFGTVLQDAGYATAVAGKWQLQGAPNGSLAPECGFSSYCLWNYPGTDRSRFWHPSIVQNGRLLHTTERDYGPDIFLKFVTEFIHQNKNRPFFVYYPMVLVHSPFVRTPDSLDGKAKSLTLFRDMTAYADKCVGRLVDVLEEHGVRENTVVIYTTDNGTGRSLTYPFADEQRKGEKAYATEGGTHAPLIVNCPELVPAGTVSDDLVDFSDFLPTLADMTGAVLPDVELDGRSFWPQCAGREGNPRQWIRQYYYPKFGPAAENHGQGVNDREIIWAQNQRYKLYNDNSFFAVADRHETEPIESGTGGDDAEACRQLLRAALDELPSKAVRLDP